MGDLIFIGIIIVTTVIGAKRGFAYSVIGIVATAVSILCGIFLCRPVSEMLLKSEIGNIISDNVGKIVTDTVSGAAGGVGAAILKSQNTVETITMLTTNAIGFFLTAIVIKLIIGLIANAMKLAVKLPVLKQINGLLGGVIGFLSGLLFCYVITGVSQAVEPSGSFSQITQIIKSSMLASMVYDSNIIMKVLTGFLK